MNSLRAVERVRRVMAYSLEAECAELAEQVATERAHREALWKPGDRLAFQGNGNVYLTFPPGTCGRYLRYGDRATLDFSSESMLRRAIKSVVRMIERRRNG